MRSTTWRTIALLSLTLILAFSAMDAQAARRSSLAGNQFINDADDMFAFPQLMLQYKNMAIIDMWRGDGEGYGWPNGAGSASFIFGDENVFMFNTGRADYLTNTAYWAFGNADFYTDGGRANGIPGINGGSGYPLEWWDLGYATELGGSAFGVNLSWAKDKDKDTDTDGDVFNDTKTNMISLQAGYTFDFADVAAEVGFGSYKDEEEGLDPQDQNDFSYFNFALAARGDIEDQWGIDWRWVAAFANGSTEPKETDAVKRSHTAFRGSFGPVYGTPGEWEVAGYMTFEHIKVEREGDTIELLNTEKWTSFPSYNIAMEYYLNDWFVFRAGAESHNATDTDTYERDISGETQEEEYVNRNYEFDWTVGFGVDKGRWGIDVAVNQDEFHSGYLPFGADTDDDALAAISAWMHW